MARKKATKENNRLTLRERSSILLLDRSSTDGRRELFDKWADTQNLSAQQREEFESTLGSIELIYAHITRIKHSNPKASSPQHSQTQ